MIFSILASLCRCVDWFKPHLIADPDDRFSHVEAYTVKPPKRPLKKKTKIGFQDRLSLNAGQKYCRMLQGEHSAIFLTFIKLPSVIKNFVTSIFEWLLKTGFTVYGIF